MTAEKEIPPYFDVLFSRLEAGEQDAIKAFGRHVHWGYWNDPTKATGTADDYAHAAEALCRKVCDAAQIRDGMRILDVGCGTGGTIASLNERFANLTMVGVNIDARQLQRARQITQAQNGNRITFQEGDACNLQFAPGSFDVVLAVECIFHFPERRAFFQGASRALVDGGRMALSDFVPSDEGLSILTQTKATNDRAMQATYGKIDVTASLERYRELAQCAQMEMIGDLNINENTLPTYPFLREHQRSWPDPDAAKLFDRATRNLQLVCQSGLLHYRIVSFRKKANCNKAVA
jgi:ubiquinone/menaquinone biosynthesis C-methylase UbiE